MKKFLVPLAILGISACNSNQTENYDSLENIEDVENKDIKLSDRDLIRVCKAGAAFRNGRSIEGIDAKITGSQRVRISYDRDYDEKHFDYDCLVEGNVIRFRMIDEAGPNTGPGNWSGRGSKTTFKLNPNSVELNDDFFDGSSDTKTIEI